MKILLFCNSGWNIYNFRLNFIKKISKKNEVYSLSSKDKYIYKIKKKFKKNFYVNLNNRSTNILIEFVKFLKILFIVIKLKPHLILNFSHKPIIYGTLASFFSKSKVINVVTGIGHIFSLKKFFTIKILKFLYRIIEYKFNFIIFQNQRDSIFFYKNNFITKKKNIVIIEGSGIETNKFKPNNNCLNSKKIVFTYFGRILPEKGIVEFIKAASILKKKNKNINFNLVGDFNKKLLNKKFVNFVLENIQNNVVKYSPHSNNIINEYKKTSCVVLPSYREGISRTLLEACALKKFVITTNVPGCSDVIKHNFNGFVCRPKSVISLSRSMSNFLKLNHNLIKKMQNRSRAIILRRFDEKIILKKFLEVIEKL